MSMQDLHLRLHEIDTMLDDTLDTTNCAVLENERDEIVNLLSFENQES